MTRHAPGCARAWQAEAIEDDRLSSAERASFERHLATCRTCTLEVRRLARLRAAGAGLPSAENTPLEHRRQRIELLRRANDRLVRGASPRQRAIVAAALATLAVSGAAVASWSASRTSPAETTPSALATASAPASPHDEVPTFRIATSEDAPWYSVESGSTVRVSVARGRFELTVDKLKAGQRFFVDLPDGELEVKGTRFELDLDGQRTRSVRVFEGRVALRIRGEDPRTLDASESFTSDTTVSATAAAAGDRPPSTASSRPSAPMPTPPASPASPDTLPPASSRPAAEGTTAGADLAAALAAFSAGDYENAEALFRAFEAKHPGDARVEDAAFSIAVARARRGDASGARTAARDYLRRYPTGFRRQEALHLAEGSD